ncbi:hypothetical protein CIB48_g5358 [Xylaria polymorpha]|nr:hypothetical protein CIB48_g5358 [Xylaria polymorpha]
MDTDQPQAVGATFLEKQSVPSLEHRQQDVVADSNEAKIEHHHPFIIISLAAQILFALPIPQKKQIRTSFFYNSASKPIAISPAIPSSSPGIFN